MTEQSCLVVMYHYVRDSAATGFPQIRALAPELFARQLDWLQEQYTVIGIHELQAAIEGRGTLPPQAALLTFDDGFIDHFTTVFPLLRERGLSGVFFLAGQACGPSPRLLGVHKTHFLLAHLGAEALSHAVRREVPAAEAVRTTSRAVFGNDRWEAADERALRQLLNYELPFAEADRILEQLFAHHLGDATAFARRLYLDEAMIREMAAAGIVFGYHTRTHRMLSRLSPDEQQRELADGVDWIRALTRQESIPFCYPWGGPQTYTVDTVRILERLGYSLAFNTVRRRLRIGHDGRFELPRFDTRDLPPHTRGEEDARAAAMAEDW